MSWGAKSLLLNNVAKMKKKDHPLHKVNPHNFWTHLPFYILVFLIYFTWCNIDYTTGILSDNYPTIFITIILCDIIPYISPFTPTSNNIIHLFLSHLDLLICHLLLQSSWMTKSTIITCFCFLPLPFASTWLQVTPLLCVVCLDLFLVKMDKYITSDGRLRKESWLTLQY